VASLRRELGLPALAVYGIGGMLGGGIYALVGEVAGLAGRWSPLSFLLAMVVAAPTALTYAELVARHPRSGGEAAYSKRAFGGERVPWLVGWTVLGSGIVSMATLARAFAGYVQELAPGTPTVVLVIAFLTALGALNVRGIRVASTANVVCTVVETAGLVVIIAIGAVLLADGGAPPEAASEPDGAAATWTSVLHGAALAFYAFIGFEDMVNVSEEVKRPRRAFPVAIPLALLVVGGLYAAVSFAANLAVDADELSASSAPLTLVASRGAAWFPTPAFTVIAVFAVANTALLNYVMASRLVYGMARERLLPRWLGSVQAGWRTPMNAILVIYVVATLLAVSGGVASLAAATSFLLLAVFFTMNVALVRLRRTTPRPDGFRCPGFVPWLGMVLSIGLATLLPARSILVALLLVAVGGAILVGRSLVTRSG